MNLKKKVIIDCDPGIDDALALMFALSCEELEVLAVTAVCGNVPVTAGADNARTVLKLMGRQDIPVEAGAAAPLQRPLVTAQDTHGEDGLGEAGWGSTASEQYKDREKDKTNPAAELIVRLLRSEPQVSIIALGPMTNIACAMKSDPEAFKNTESFVSMGGSYKSHGNCSPVAEFNYWADPEAARYVYEHTPVKIHMVGLDVTRKIVLKPDICSLIGRFHNEKSRFILDITKFYIDFHWAQERIIGCVINDPLAVAYFISLCREEKIPLCEGFESYTTVETEGMCAGQTIVDAYNFWGKDANAKVLVKTDARRFMEMFLTRIFPEYDEEIKIGMREVYGNEKTF